MANMCIQVPCPRCEKTSAFFSSQNISCDVCGFIGDILDDGTLIDKSANGVMFVQYATHAEVSLLTAPVTNLSIFMEKMKHPLAMPKESFVSMWYEGMIVSLAGKEL